MSIGWNFPNNNNAEIIGIGEAGIETFKGNLFGSLAREICQNSLDARNDFEKPVKVEFVLNNIDRKNIPGIDTLLETMILCKEFWNGNKKTVNFFNQASKICEKNSIRILRVSDYNTTGLKGSDKLKSSPWQDLVKSSGVSNKNGESGGSFGIGKSAPFACSDLRTIFYSTLDSDGLKASQGVARLVSFENKKSGNFSKKIDITQGKGYYGEMEDNSPMKNLISFGEYRREEVGTDLYILGFVEHDSWKDEIIKKLIEEYLISILQGDLIVQVDDIEISNKNINLFIEKYKEEIPLACNYYEVLTSDDAFKICEDFENLGKVELRIMIKKDFRRKVLMSRNNGMKIFDKQNISGTIPFAGVCILKDLLINEFFREMENPQHNNWEPERHSDVKKAKKLKQKLFSFIKEKVFEFGKATVLDEMDAVGAGEFIPDLDDSISSEGGINEIIENEIKNFSELEKNVKILSQTGIQTVEDFDIESEIEDFGGLDFNSDELGTLNDHTNRYKRKNKGQDKNCVGNELNEGNIKLNKTILVKLLKLRLFMYDNTKYLYKLSFEPEESVNEAYIEISVSGEQSNSNLEINYAANEYRDLLRHKNNKIFIGNIKKGKKYSFFYGIKYNEMCSMEVAIHGYKI